MISEHGKPNSRKLRTGARERHKMSRKQATAIILRYMPGFTAYATDLGVELLGLDTAELDRVREAAIRVRAPGRQGSWQCQALAEVVYSVSMLADIMRLLIRAGVNVAGTDKDNVTAEADEASVT